MLFKAASHTTFLVNALLEYPSFEAAKLISCKSFRVSRKVYSSIGSIALLLPIVLVHVYNIVFPTPKLSLLTKYKRFRSNAGNKKPEN